MGVATSTLVVGGIAAATAAGGAYAASKSKTTKSDNSSWTTLGSQSSLDSFLTGAEELSEEGRQSLWDLEGRVNAAASMKDDMSLTPARRAMAAKDYITYSNQLAAARQGADKKKVGGFLESGFKDLVRQTNNRPTADFEAGQGASRDLASILKQYSETGGLPGQADIDAGTSLSKSLFAARRTSLEQDLQDQYTQAGQQSAMMGRSGSDPVLTAKLRTGFMKQRDLLSAEQQAQATGIAMQLPGQRLGYSAQRADTLNTVADRSNQYYQQGLTNLGTLLSMGSQLAGQENQFRFASGVQQSQGKNTTPGAGALAGGLAGFGQGMQIGSGFSNLMGGGTSFSGMGAGQGSTFGLGQASQFNQGAQPGGGYKFGMFG